MLNRRVIVIRLKPLLFYSLIAKQHSIAYLDLTRAIDKSGLIQCEPFNIRNNDENRVLHVQFQYKIILLLL